MTDPALPGYTGGILNITGTRPENAFKYEGPAMQGGIWYSVTFESTYDAIERLIVPPGLTVNRDVPPTVELQFFVNPRTRAFDGRVTPYKGFMFMAHVKHGDVAGRAGWEYVDGLYGDKTQMDIMGPWSVYFGMLKKMADIHFTPIGGNEFEVTVIRRGVRLVTLTIRVGAELAPEDVELINESSSQWPRTLTVREIPNVNYSGLSERTVCIAGTDSGNTITRAWAADKGTVTFGRDELDPLDEPPRPRRHRCDGLRIRHRKRTFQCNDRTRTPSRGGLRDSRFQRSSTARLAPPYSGPRSAVTPPEIEVKGGLRAADESHRRRYHMVPVRRIGTTRDRVSGQRHLRRRENVMHDIADPVHCTSEPGRFWTLANIGEVTPGDLDTDVRRVPPQPPLMGKG